MPFTHDPGRPARRSWLTWGLSTAVLVLLAAAGGGVIARHFYASQTVEPPPVVIPPVTEQPGSRAVELAPGALAHPDHETVRGLLQIHFDAINVRRYDQWKTTVVTAKQRQMPEKKWRREYESTHDGSIVVQRIESGPDDSLRALLTFTSVQDPKHAPATMPEPCLRWRAVYPLVQDSGQLRLDTGLPGSALFDRC